MVRTGTQLFSVVQSQDIWVTANFKETQLASFPIGKKVKMTLQMHIQKKLYRIVETIGGATGSKFALLPRIMPQVIM
jgi:Multidrug resistance efflux pump